MALVNHDLRPKVSRRTLRALRVGGLLAAIPFALTACSWSDLGMSTSPAAAAPQHSASARSTAHSTSATTADAADTIDTGVRYVRGELAAGTVTHKVSMGNRNMVITYWTSRNVGEWQSTQSASLQLAAHIENSRSSLKIVVSRFSATFIPDRDAAASSLRTDTGSFTVTPPFSYNTALTVPAVGVRTTSALLNVEFDLLVETAPNSGQYFRQTVLDTVSFTYPTAANA